MRILPILFLFTFLVISCDEPGIISPDRRLEAIEGLRASLAPDSRTDRVEVELAGDTLKGYTTVDEADNKLRQLADTEGYIYKVRRLPDERVGEADYGIIRVATANLRSKPGHSQELASQSAFGTPIRVLDRSGGWYLVRTPNRYLAWLEAGAFTRITRRELDDYLAQQLTMIARPGINLVKAPYGRDALGPAPPGAIVSTEGPLEKDHQRVLLPDSTSAYYKREAGDTLGLEEGFDTERLLETAEQFTGQPYLWGGTSAYGLDCSGFTSLAYYLNGYVIPRDASQQVRAGLPVELTEDLSAVERGDLLFFGNFREDGSERITHVGFYLGDGRFLHAGADNGRIMENNLIEGRPNYNQARRQTLMQARRLVPNTPEVVAQLDAFRAL